MIRFRYPVDTDQFQQIREDGKVYVDKTDLMFDLVDRYKYVFLANLLELVGIYGVSESNHTLGNLY